MTDEVPPSSSPEGERIAALRAKLFQFANEYDRDDGPLPDNWFGDVVEAMRESAGALATLRAACDALTGQLEERDQMHLPTRGDGLRLSEATGSTAADAEGLLATTAPEDALRHAWEAGFKLCRSYGDNHAHFDGEQKERHWQAYLSIRAAMNSERLAAATAPETYKFFVDDTGYETERRALTSMEIKQVAGVPLNHRLGHDIGRRFVAGDEQLFLSDDEGIDVTGEPKHFYSVPHARY